jgi:ketosteroid isomerase-like protein
MRLLACLFVFALFAMQTAPGATREELTAQVRAAETAFADSMAKRDFEAFAAHVADEAVFFGQRGELRGKAAVLEEWKQYFSAPEAPFSWKPESVAVLDSGKLALSSGPVFDPGGRRVGTFNSTWRLEPDGRWRVVFDNGCPACACTQP